MSSKLRLEGPPFCQIPEWVLDSPLSDKAIRLYLVLWSYADRKTLVAWPSRSVLAERLGCSVKTVQRLIGELEEFGALSHEQRHRSGQQTTNLYTLAWTGTPVSTRLPGLGGDRDTHVPPRGDTHVPRPGDTHVPQNQNQLELEPLEPEPLVAAASSSTTSPRTRDPIWDTLVEICGAPPPDQKGNYGKTVSWLKQQGATPEKMHDRAGRIAEEFRGGQYVTAASLRKHWTRYDALVGQMNGAEMDSKLEERRRQQSDANLLQKIAQKATSGVSEDRMLGDSR